MLPIQVRRARRANEELRAVRMLTSIGHGETAHAFMKYIHLIIVLNLLSIQSYYRTNIINH